MSNLDPTSVSMRKLIAGEMSKEVEDNRQSSNNVVAKLMGLETCTPRSRSRSSKHSREFEDGYGSKSDNKQLDLVRRKFMEAKRMVKDDSKLHKSMEFQEALGFLSSNKDLLVKFLEESNSLFSQHLSDVPLHQEAKRITVLRPVDAQRCVVQDSRSKEQDIAQPTRIVVLKPSPRKALDIKAIAASSPHSYGDDDDETREVAKEITRQIRETFKATTLSSPLSSPSSSVLSNGYIGDDGSVNRSNISNSEIMSSRHSWDCGNRFESPFSSSSLSRVSFSPESSVYREAKKRLSERWAMMSLNGDTQQLKASTALGEMLALPTKTSVEIRQESRRSVSCIGSGLDQVEIANDTLERSKSVPEIRLNGGTRTSKPQASRELNESKSLKTSWKVSSFFFFRNKKTIKEKTADTTPSQLSMPTDALQQQSIFTNEGELQNQDQPSPVSVLQPPFEEENVGNPKCSTQGEEMSLKSTLIDKSPPIGSLARVLSWEDESYTDMGSGIKEDEDWYAFIKTLLTASGFSGSDPLLTRWHSPDSPMDLSLRDKFAEKELVKQRSTRKLVFDCVNAIITETTSKVGHGGLTEGFDMVEHVWTEFLDWVVQDSNSLEVESVVIDEVVGKMWSRNLQVEANNLGIEIEVILLQELVQEAVFDITQ